MSDASNRKGPTWHPATVMEVGKETNQDTTIVLTAPPLATFAPAELNRESGTLLFRAGQFIMLRDPNAELTKEDGTKHPMSAAYSLSGCSGANAQGTFLRVTVRRTGDRGIHFHDLKEGHALEITAPAGNFVLDLPEEHQLVMVAGGSGVAPFRTFVEWLRVDVDRVGRVDLFHSARDTDSLVFQGEFEAWDKATSWFHYHPTLTSEGDDQSPIERGRFNKERIGKHIEDASKTVVYACGPGELVGAAMAWAEELGVAPDNRRREQW